MMNLTQQAELRKLKRSTHIELIINGDERGHYAHIELLHYALILGMPNIVDGDGHSLGDVVDDYRATGGHGDLCEFSAEFAQEAEEYLHVILSPTHSCAWVDGSFFIGFVDDMEVFADSV